MEARRTRFDLEYRVKTVDSGYIWKQNRGKIVYDWQGKAINVPAATIDITERKQIVLSTRIGDIGWLFHKGAKF
jgi:PAS domain-containing protein